MGNQQQPQQQHCPHRNCNRRHIEQQKLNSTNRIAVFLNNVGVVELEAGRLTTAFQIFSKAASMTVHDVPIHVDDVNGIYRFEWVRVNTSKLDPHHIDNTNTNTNTNNRYGRSILQQIQEREQQQPQQQPQQQQQQQILQQQYNQQQQVCYNEGMSSFLCLRALKILVQENSLMELDQLCPCGYTWVIWYNLAMTCNVIGTRLGESGHQFLKHANQLFEKVQTRIDVEPPSNHWLLLELAITNNQAFICRELDHDMTDTKMQQLMDKLTTTLCSPVLDCGEKDWNFFYFNVMTLKGETVAKAA